MYEKEDSTKVNNYRAASVLSTVSKICRANNRINILHERALRLVYHDYETSL